MVTDHQVRKLMKLMSAGEPLAQAALKSGMSENTARKYRRAGELPSERRAERSPRNWRTREDPFAEVWEELRALLEVNPGLQAHTLFTELQRRYPGPGRAVTESPAQEQSLAGAGRPGERGLLPPGAPPRRARRVGLLPPHRPGRHH